MLLTTECGVDWMKIGAIVSVLGMLVYRALTSVRFLSENGG